MKKIMLACSFLLFGLVGFTNAQSNDELARKALLNALDPFNKSAAVLEVRRDMNGKILSCTKDGVPCDPADCFPLAKKADCGCGCPADCNCDRGSCQCANCRSATNKQPRSTASPGMTYGWNGTQWTPMTSQPTVFTSQPVMTTGQPVMTTVTGTSTAIRPQRALLPWNAGPVYQQQPTIKCIGGA